MKSRAVFPYHSKSFDNTSVYAEPCEGSLHNLSLGQKFKANLIALDDFYWPWAGFAHSWPLITTTTADFLDEWEAGRKFVKHQSRRSQE